MRSMGSVLLACRRMVVYVALTVVLIPVQAAAVALELPLRERLPLAYHRLCARILGLRLVTHGAPSPARPTLFVANHTSYLDITILAALIPGSFVAKQEVARWPFFGLLAKLQRTVFVDRRVGSTGAQRDAVIGRLEAGDRLILFPEGTSGDGNRTLPFKSALFAAAAVEVDGQPVTVQPVSVAYTALDGIPLGRALRPAYAWYGDMDLMPHMWAMIGLGELTVQIVFHPPVTLPQLGSRKALADHCWRAVSDGLSRANAGRLGPDIVAPAAAIRLGEDEVGAEA